MAAELGFEPRQHESESWVLPLHNSAICQSNTLRTRPTNDIISLFGGNVKGNVRFYFVLTLETKTARHN